MPMKTSTFVLCSVVASFVCGHRSFAADLASLRTKYETEKEKIENSFNAAGESSLLAYSNSLTAIEGQLKKEGNLDGLLAVRKEIERFTAAMAVARTASEELPPAIV